MSQMVLHFPICEDYSSESFLPLSHVQSALEALKSLRTGLVIYGEKGVGKTHLLKTWAEETGATYQRASELQATVDLDFSKLALDLDDLSQQESCFALINHCLTEGKICVVSSDLAIAKREDLIPELKSRLLLLDQAAIEKPAESDLEVLIVKWAADRQMNLSPDVMQYLLLRCERDVGILRGILNHLDETALAEKRAITKPLVRKVLEGGAA
jgi:chromosomal replication initiation ATPase DnaA